MGVFFFIWNQLAISSSFFKVRSSPDILWLSTERYLFIFAGFRVQNVNLKRDFQYLQIGIGDPPAPTVYALVHHPKYIPKGAQQRGGIVGAIGTGFTLIYHWKPDAKVDIFETWIQKFCLCLGSALGEGDHVIVSRDHLHLKCPAGCPLSNGTKIIGIRCLVMKISPKMSPGGELQSPPATQVLKFAL